MGKFVRKIFTADKNIILSTVGHLSEEKTHEVLNAVIAIISS
jgi:mRNA-degrading endonuclease toxin of MazEF toxin-antitoxin module